MVGKTLSHYRIVEKIDAGGMGEVYRARDEHLNRDVAVKVLPAGTLADEHARKRFRKEAEALSKLNHPHIATIHDFDTQDGVDFLAMELVEGATLAERLTQASLPEKEIARLGAQIADALQEAHEQAIVHRDLKPGNIKLTAKGQAKVLDFGIAKLLKPTSDATTETFTETQALAGTLPYMSPEQLKGEPVDARSDIYSFGVMVYEMATGRRPFQQKLSTALSDAILHEPPPAPRSVNHRLSPVLENIILKCLEKEPERRYQSAKELLVDLRRLGAPATVGAVARPRRRFKWFTPALAVVLALAVAAIAIHYRRQHPPTEATPPAGKVMLAVLPFDNLSGDPEQEYFSDGMTEELIAHLGGLQPARLGVIARTSVMLYKDSAKPIDQIGQELGVDYILEGSVRREAERVRITAQLIQVSDQTHLWAENYERELAGVFAIQSDVAGRIARSLEVELLPSVQARLAGARPVDPEAHEAYLKGRYYWNTRPENWLERAIELFQLAILKDPGYARAYAGLADTYWLQGRHELTKSAALAALKLDEELAEAHATLAAYSGRVAYDWSAAEDGFRRAIALNPSYATAHHWYSLVLNMLGRQEEALTEAKRAQELDPLSLITSVNLAHAFDLSGEREEALGVIRRAIKIDPSFAAAHVALGNMKERDGLYAEAVAEYEKALELGGYSFIYGYLGHAYAVSGNSLDARRIVDALKQGADSDPFASYALAKVYAGLGEKELAFRWLEEAFESHQMDLPSIAIDYRFDPLRSDPRFQDLLRRMNLPE